MQLSAWHLWMAKKPTISDGLKGGVQRLFSGAVSAEPLQYLTPPNCGGSKSFCSAQFRPPRAGEFGPLIENVLLPPADGEWDAVGLPACITVSCRRDCKGNHDGGTQARRITSGLRGHAPHRTVARSRHPFSRPQPRPRPRPKQCVHECCMRRLYRMKRAYSFQPAPHEIAGVQN